MKLRLNFLYLILITIGIGGCASIPLSTAVRLSSLKPSSLAHIDPAQVRVRLSVSSGYEVDIPKSRLKLSLLGSRSATRTADMPLTLLRRSNGQRPGGLFSPDAPVTTYELALSPEGAHELRGFQKSLLTNGHGKFEFNVSAPFSKIPPKAESVTFWADLKLSNKDAYLPLIDDASLQLTNEAAARNQVRQNPLLGSSQ